MAFRNQALNGETVTSGIRSDNYVLNVDGWRLSREGDIHFAGGRIRVNTDAPLFNYAGWEFYAGLFDDPAGIFGNSDGSLLLKSVENPVLDPPAADARLTLFPNADNTLTEARLEAGIITIGRAPDIGFPGSETTVNGTLEVTGDLGALLQAAIQQAALDMIAGWAHGEASKGGGGGLQSIPTGTLTTLTWPTIANLTGGLTEDGAGVWTIPDDGLYLIGGSVLFDTNATGRRQINIVRNSFAISVNNLSAANAAGTGITFGRGVLELSAGDEIEIAVLQNSGGNLDIAATTFLSITRMR